MRKKITLFLVATFSISTAFAQTGFRMSYGAGAIIGLPKTIEAKIGTPLVNSPRTFEAYAGSYGALIFPKYHIKNNISIGVPLFIGASFSSNSQTGSSSSFGYHLPVCATYHFGSSVFENEDMDGLMLGGYVGAGLGLANASYGIDESSTSDVSNSAKIYATENDFYNNFKSRSFGPFMHAGIQLKNPLSRNDDSNKKIGIRVAYQLPLNPTMNYVVATLTYNN